MIKLDKHRVNMNATYWSQFSHSEIISLHGVEDDESLDDDVECECESRECVGECPDCFGSGCNYCLML